MDGTVALSGYIGIVGTRRGRNDSLSRVLNTFRLSPLSHYRNYWQASSQPFPRQPLHGLRDDGLRLPRDVIGALQGTLASAAL